MPKDLIQKYKMFLQKGLLFDDEEGFDKKNFRRKFNPEVDYDKVESIINEVRENEIRKIVKEVKKRIRRINLEDAMTDSFSEFKHFLLAQVDIVERSEITDKTGGKE